MQHDDSTALAAADHLSALDTDQLGELVQRAAAMEAKSAAVAGAVLVEAKRRLAHGEWKAWLARWWPKGASTARLYMQLAQNANALALSDGTTVRQARAAITKPRKQAPEPTDYAAGVVTLSPEVLERRVAEAGHRPHKPQMDKPAKPQRVPIGEPGQFIAYVDPAPNEPGTDPCPHCNGTGRVRPDNVMPPRPDYNPLRDPANGAKALDHKADDWQWKRAANPKPAAPSKPTKRSY